MDVEKWQASNISSVYAETIPYLNAKIEWVPSLADHADFVKFSPTFEIAVWEEKYID